MPLVWRKGTFGTGGPTRVRPNPMSATPKPVPDINTALYIGLEDNVEWLVTEDTSDPLISE
jgi:hypothetical protein